MTNLFREDASVQAAYTLAGRDFPQLVYRLDALLMVLKSCYGQECHEPWKTIHPSGTVKNLKHALDPKLDAFYENQPKVKYNSCQLGYLVAEEGPQHVHAWSEDTRYPVLASEADVEGRQRSFRYQSHWSWFA